MVVPKGWVEKKIEDFPATVVSGGTPSTFVSEYWGGNIPWMNSGELNLKRVCSVEGRITLSGLNNSSTCRIPANSVLIGLAGQGKTRGTVAITYFELCTNQSIASILPNPEVFDSEYLYQNLDNRYDELRELSTGDGGRGGLNLTIIRRLSVFFPPLSEQRRIAAVLSDTDLFITALENLIAKKRAVKQGTMQELLTGKRRLPGFQGEWVEKPLKSICKSITTGKLDANAMISGGQYRFYTCAKDYFYIDNYAFDTEALLVSGNGENVGYIHYYKGKFNAYQRTYVMTDFLVNINWLKHYLDMFLSVRIANEVNLGNTPYIKLDTLTDMIISCPKPGEQTAIASILSDMDAEIDTMTAKLNKLRHIKQGMMSELLTGRIRLIKEEAENDEK